MRDWLGIRAEIGDRVFYATADGARKPRLHEAWVEAVGETHIRVRPTASPFDETAGNDHEVRWLFIGPKASLWSRGMVLSDLGLSARQRDGAMAAKRFEKNTASRTVAAGRPPSPVGEPAVAGSFGRA